MPRCQSPATLRPSFSPARGSAEVLNSAGSPPPPRQGLEGRFSKPAPKGGALAPSPPPATHLVSARALQALPGRRQECPEEARFPPLFGSPKARAPGTAPGPRQKPIRGRSVQRSMCVPEARPSATVRPSPAHLQ